MIVFLCHSVLGIYCICFVWDALQTAKPGAVNQRWAVDWTWIGLDPNYNNFFSIWMRSGL